MRRFLLLALAPAALAAQPGFEKLFNGRNLDGWEAHTPEVWSARDGMIVGKSAGLKYNDFLRTKRTFDDFELRLKLRLVNGQGNSGVQFRSRAVPDSPAVSGYQADVGQQYWGSLYDEARRKKILLQSPPAALAGLDTNGWHDYVIVARGNDIIIELDGRRTVEYREADPEIDQTGIIALQIHSGPPMEVHFKDIRIRELKERPAAEASAPAPASRPGAKPARR